MADDDQPWDGISEHWYLAYNHNYKIVDTLNTKCFINNNFYFKSIEPAKAAHKQIREERLVKYFTYKKNNMNEKRYKLLKDLPGLEAGSIFKYNSATKYYECNSFSFKTLKILQSPDWFEEIPAEPEAPKSWEDMDDQYKSTNIISFDWSVSDLPRKTMLLRMRLNAEIKLYDLMRHPAWNGEDWEPEDDEIVDYIVYDDKGSFIVYTNPYKFSKFRFTLLKESKGEKFLEKYKDLIKDYFMIN